ncbi:MAG: NAD-glutamate dehydrogenase, partial [Alphaproteobacteria bacterium]
MSSKTPKEKTRSKDALVDAMARRAKRGHGKRAPVVERFVRDFFANVSPKDCSEADPEALAGAVQSAWAHVQTRKAGAAKVRVFNLDPEKDDWNVGHTIVEIVNDDMPFLVDSVTAELNRRNLTVHLVIHPIMAVVRTRAGKLSDVLDAAEPPDGQRESIMHIQVTEQADPAALKELRGGILRVLGDVRTAVEDWRPMRVCLADAIAGLDTTAGLVQREEISETADFLRWLEANNFTFLGYREYAIGTSGKKQKLKVVRKSGLGLLRDKTVVAIEGMEDGAVLPPDLAEILQRPSLTLINKGSRRSTVHRGVHLDAIMIKQFDESGRTVGQRLFVGLFTSTVYNQPVETIPVIRKKARRVIERSGFSSVSHDGKALTHILETLPRDELFQIGERELSDMAMGILHLQERQKVALFTRHDPFGRYVSCLVYVPRDRYDTRLRRRIHDVLETGFAGTVTAFYTQLSDEVPARLHFIVKTGDRERKAKPLSEIEAEVIETARDWADDLAQALSDDHGESEGLSLFDR